MNTKNPVPGLKAEISERLSNLRRLGAALGVLAAATALQVAVARVHDTSVNLTIVKRSEGNTIAPGTVFSFAVSENGGPAQEKTASVNGPSATYSTTVRADPGSTSIQVQEAEVPGVRLTAISCSDAASVTPSYNVDARTAVLSVTNEPSSTVPLDINCTFYNEALPKVTIVKHVVPPGSETFTFDIRGEVDLRRAVSSVVTNAVVSLTDNGTGIMSHTFYAEDNFFYNIMENGKLPWLGQLPVCTLGNAYGPLVDGTVGAAIYLRYGNDVTCEFTNTLTTLDIVKVVSGSIGGDFVFTVTRNFDECGDGCFVDEATMYTLTVPANGRITHTLVITDRPEDLASYEITEMKVAGFTASQPTCTGVSFAGLNRAGRIPLDTGTGVFIVAPGVAASCEFTNTPNVLNIVKVVDPPGTDTFTFDLSTNDNCIARGTGCASAQNQQIQLTDDGSGRVTHTMLLTHTGFVNFVLREPIPNGYVGNGITCEGGLQSQFPHTPETTDMEAGFGFDATGQNITCTATNIKLSKLVLVKDAQPDSATPFTVTVDPASKQTPGLTGNINLTESTSVVLVDAGAPGPNQHVFNNVLGGTGGSSNLYTLSEQPGPRTNASVTCISEIDLGGLVHEYDEPYGGSYLGNVPIRAGDVVTCTIVNELPGSLVIIKDTVPDSSTPFSFTVEIHPDDLYCQLDLELNRRASDDNPVGCAEYQGQDEFVLIDDGTAISNTRSYAELRTYRYLITEAGSPPYAQAVACQSRNQSSTFQTSGGAIVDLSLGAGDAVTCTFTNSAPTPTPTITPTPTQTPTPTNTPTPSPTPTATPRVNYTLVLTSNPESGTIVASNQLVTYFVTFSANFVEEALARAGAVQANATITTLIPSNSSLVPGSITNGGSATGNTVVWQLTNFNGGDVFRANYVVRVAGGNQALLNNAVAGVVGSGPIQSPNLVHPLPPLAVNLATFTANGRTVVWETLGEFGTVGFLLYRVEGAHRGSTLPGDALLVSDGMIAAYGPAAYTSQDRSALAGKTYTYYLVEVNVQGSQVVIGSATTRIQNGGSVYLPLTTR